MIPSRTKLMLCLLGLATSAGLLRAQNLPAATGPSLYHGFGLPLAGQLTYSLTGSESLRFGYYGTTVYSTSVSGNLAFATSSKTRPTSLTYSGGFRYNTGYGNNANPGQFFQNVSLGQTLQLRRWNVNVHDSFSLLPDAPIGSFSGIPGLGDVGVTNPGGVANQDLLTNGATRITNDIGGSVSRPITGRTTFQANGDYDITKFTGSNVTNAISTNTIGGSASIQHALSPIRSYSIAYNQSHFTYPGLSVPFSFDSQSVQGGYQASLSRVTHFSVAVGPNRIITKTATADQTTFDVNAQGSISRSLERSAISANFNRSVRGGSGVTPGALATTASVDYSYEPTRLTSLAFSAAYNRSGRVSNLAIASFSTQTITFSGQASRQLGRNFFGYFSYSLLKQGLSGSANNATAFNGVSHVVAAGITYAPRAIQLGHQ